MQQLQDEILTTAAAARVLERSESTVREYDRTGKLSSIRTSSGQRLFTRSAVEALRRARMEAIAKEKDVTETKFNDLLSTFKETMGGVTDTLKDGTSIAARDMVHELENILSGTTIEIPYEFVATNKLQLGGIPALGRGGIVTRPTLALVGESGHEAVIPLGHGAAPAVGDRVTNVYSDGRVLAQSVARDLPGILELHGVRR